MKESLTRMLGAVSTLLLIGLFVIAAAPVWAGSLEERIKALEEEQRANREELGRLKGEQQGIRNEALAAKAKLPTFSYRQGRGLSIWAADKSWGFRTRLRWHHRLNFWPDDDAVAQNGFSQWDQQPRRIYPYFTYYWDKGFYELDYQQNLSSANRDIFIQKMEFKIRFDKINPWLPFLTIGPRVSGFFNKHDTNWSSSSGGFFDRTMMQDGAGIGAGTQVNAIGLDWRKLPIGPGQISILQFVISNQGLQNQATAGQANALNDNKAFHGAIQIEPFKKSKNKWIKGIDFGMGAQIEDVHTSSSGRSLFRVRTTERIRLRLIEVNEDIRGTRWYLTPGFGWKVGPYWLRTALGYNRGRFSNINNTRTTPGSGSLVKGDMWRVGHELWAWSPKGLFTGSHKRPGSILLFQSFERVDYEAPNNGLRDCSSITLNGECTRAHTTLNNLGAWYVVRPGLEVGMEWGHYRVNKIGRGGDDIRRNRDKSGDDVKFDSLEFGIRVEW